MLKKSAHCSGVTLELQVTEEKILNGYWDLMKNALNPYIILPVECFFILSAPLLLYFPDSYFKNFLLSETHTP